MSGCTREEELQLLEKLRGGDEQAFLQLIEQYHPMLRRLARIHAGSTAAAEDLAQATWVHVLRRINRFDRRSTLRMWIARMLLETARVPQSEWDGLPSSSVEDAEPDGVRPAVDPRRFRSDSHWRVPPHPFDDGALGRSPADHVVEWAKASVDGLPRVERTVVTLRDTEGWTASEVCGLLAISDARQRAVLQRGRSAVCAALEEHVAQACGVGGPV